MALRPELLLVHVDEGVRRVLAQRLEREDYGVQAGASLAEVAELFDQADMILVQLGGTVGVEPLLEIRDRSDVLVLGLVDVSDEFDTVDALEAGADDCVPRPFSARELVARIRAVMRRSTAKLPTTLEYGHLHIDVRSREVRRNGELLGLPARQFELLLFLARHPREVITRSRLLEEVWGSSSSWQAEDTVTEHVFRLRHHLEDDPRDPKIIQTVRGVGYRFVP